MVLMWLNKNKLTDTAVEAYRQSLLNSSPNYVVIDGLFDESQLEAVMKVLYHSTCWNTQKHTYASLYVDNAEWEQAPLDERFVKRDAWQRESLTGKSADFNSHSNSHLNSHINSHRNAQSCELGDTAAHNFLAFLRSDEFMALLSDIFKVPLTDVNVAEPEINTNYFRLGAADFVEQHADDSPGREVCMLLYLNKNWQENVGGELVFLGDGEQSVSIAPLFNRCVLFDPASEGAEHWVKRLTSECASVYRYNVTSWYWSE